jgi:hypothetical protein
MRGAFERAEIGMAAYPFEKIREICSVIAQSIHIEPTGFPRKCAKIQV